MKIVPFGLRRLTLTSQLFVVSLSIGFVASSEIRWPAVPANVRYAF